MTFVANISAYRRKLHGTLLKFKGNGTVTHQ